MWKRDGKQGCETLCTPPFAVNDMTCCTETKNSSPFKSHQLWGMFLLRTLLNVIIGVPNEIWSRSPICLHQPPYWLHADAYQNDECSIKFKWVGRLGKEEKSCLSLHDLVLFSAPHCKTAYYFNQMFSDFSNRVIRAYTKRKQASLMWMQWEIEEEILLVKGRCTENIGD